MRPSSARAFASIGKNALRWEGATREDIARTNAGKDVTKLIEGIERVEKEAEAKYGGKAAVLKIQGSKLHKSTRDPSETKEVLTVSVHTERGTSLEADHVREDGTSTRKETRAGQTK